MALFKIFKGKSENLPINKVDGYCYVTTNDHKFYVDYTKDDGVLDRFALNAVYADTSTNSDKLDGYHFSDLEARYVNTTGDTMSGTLNLPNLSFNNGSGMIYADDGDTTTFGGLVLCSSTEGWYGGGSLSLRDCSSSNDSPGNFMLKAQKVKGSAEDHYLLVGHADSGVLDWNGTNFSVWGTGRLGPTGHTISTNGSIGANQEIWTNSGFYTNSHLQQYYNGNWYPTVCNHANGNITINAAGEGLYLGNFNTQRIGLQINGTSFADFDINSHRIWGTTAGHTPWAGSALEIRECQVVGNSQDHFDYAPKIGFHWADRASGVLCYEADSVYRFRWSDGSLAPVQAGSVWGAVWNDYAEFRDQFETIKPGYCVASADNGKVYKTTEKFQACDGIVSDTAGFFIGETDECKTPLAVAGRVLAYFHGERSDYHSGDTVCAGPEGKVMKMTREEIKEYPDRIIGIVSEIPEYETWGSGNVAVNGRIWIKVR